MNKQDMLDIEEDDEYTDDEQMEVMDVDDIIDQMKHIQRSMNDE